MSTSSFLTEKASPGGWISTRRRADFGAPFNSQTSLRGREMMLPFRNRKRSASFPSSYRASTRASGERSRRLPCARALAYCASVIGGGGGRLLGYLSRAVFLIRLSIAILPFDLFVPDLPLAA